MPKVPVGFIKDCLLRAYQKVTYTVEDILNPIGTLHFDAMIEVRMHRAIVPSFKVAADKWLTGST